MRTMSLSPGRGPTHPPWRWIAGTGAAIAIGVAAVAATGDAPRAQAPAPAVSHAPAAGMSVTAQTDLVRTYCVGCHNDKGKAGGQSFQSFDAAEAVAHAPVTERMIRKLRAGMMPPAGAKRPEPEAVQSLIAALESRIDRAAALDPNPGYRPFQRLNRAEYAAAVKAIFGLDVDVSAFLPPDTITNSFDNIATAQAFSPTLLDGYMRAAGQISRLAVGDRTASAGSTTYKIPREASQMRHIDGTPIGTRGGLSVVHPFPADGEYVFKVALHYRPEGGLVGAATMTTMDIPEQIEVSIDGSRVALLPVNPRANESDPDNPLEVRTPPIHVAAGPRRLSAAFIERIEGAVDDLLVPLENTLADVDITYGVTLLPHVRDVTVMGPSRVTGVSDTVSRRRIFVCRPVSADEETPCVTTIMRRLAEQAYREKVADADLQDLLRFYAQGRQKGDFESGVRLAIQAMLASPKFVLRMEQGPAAASAGARAYRVSDVDLASRLSFFLWGVVPDQELMKAATSGALSTPVGLRKQVMRMLADPRSEALATRFASQWLRLQDLDKIQPDYLLYPQYDGRLAAAMKRETELFFDSIVREDRSVLDLITADYSFVNERLALHYGLPNVVGNQFRRVSLPAARRGLLGHGSILTLTSVADRTSPVLRGKWIMEVLLGSPPPPPPPNVPDLDDSAKASQNGKRLSTRERMAEHRKSPACSSCHRVIDPLGLALDNFDVTGAFRIKDNEVPVDVAGDLYDGTKIDGPDGLRQALLRHKDVVLQSFTESLMTYALGRIVEHYDMPSVRQVVRDASANDYAMSSFVLGIVNSPAFRMAQSGETTLTTPAGATSRPDGRVR
jgi:hypothetical protein